MKALLLSGYDAASHRRWWQGVVREFPHVDWVTIALPPRFFCWRFRGNALSLLTKHASLLKEEYDLILATSMTDVTSLRSWFPHLTKSRLLLYFHENQFEYPIRDEGLRRDRFHFCVQQVSAALSADALLFNSAYNRNSFLTGVTDLERRMPDESPRGLATLLASRASVLPVPIQASPSTHATVVVAAPLKILWNHRWEYDKGPDRFFLAIRKLRERGVPFELHVVGERFRKAPPCFTAAATEFAKEIITWGYLASNEDYQQLLRHCDLIISTALHDFQGLAILDAVAAGCIPLLPARLAYPEMYQKRYLYPSFLDDSEAEASALAEKIEELYIAEEPLRRPEITPYTWDVLRLRYREVFQGKEDE